MDCKKILKAELKLLKDEMDFKEYDYLASTMTMELPEALELGITKLKERIEFLKHFKNRKKSTYFLNSWSDNMIDNFEYAIALLEQVK